eukprot:7099435-Pyramimonas_sp.AAC.1
MHAGVPRDGNLPERLGRHGRERVPPLQCEGLAGDGGRLRLCAALQLPRGGVYKGSTRPLSP